jgi:folate-binding protein YgfZ
MLKPVEKAPAQTRLVDMGVVRVQGADAIKFLQGQVSNDVERLRADRSVLAGLHNAQGRAIALLRLVLAAPDEILALVPRELAATVAARLSKFVLRAKVKILDVSLEWEISGVVEHDGIAEGLPAASIGAARRDGEGRIWVCVATDGAATAGAAGTAGEAPHGNAVLGAAPTSEASTHASRSGPAHTPPSVRAPSRHAGTCRWLVASRASPSTEPRGAEESDALHVASLRPALSRDEWRALDIAAGIPEVVAATSEAFVAQMLNLDLLDGIAFDKGCYTGQEVIARAHYRGKVKRRMQRFRTGGPAKLSAGDSGTLSDGRHFKVVAAVQLSDGRSEFLAVAPMSSASGTDDEAPPAPGAVVAPLHAEALPLPYALPT